MGVSMVLFPISMLMAGTLAMQNALRVIRDKGTTANWRGNMFAHRDFHANITGLPGAKALMERFGMP